MRWCYAIVALSVSACAHTPAELRSLEPMASFTTPLAPEQAARCLGRAAEDLDLLTHAPYTAIWRSADAPGAYELVVSSMSIPRLIGELTPAGGGSRVVLWQSPAIWHATLAEDIATKCQPVGLKITARF